MFLLWAASANATEYEELKAAIEARRAALQSEFALAPAEALGEAREALTDAVFELLPHWEGTPWAMNGTSEVPGAGRIACGYLVSTVLRDAGLLVERVKLAQQASENIVMSVVDHAEIVRYRETDVAEVLSEARTPGVYVVGLDTHVGLLVVRDGEQRFCHASRSMNQQVLCEDATSARALHSHYIVVGRLSDRAVEAWASGAELPTVLVRPQN
jgi:hypothetical protein